MGNVKQKFEELVKEFTFEQFYALNTFKILTFLKI